MSGLTLDRMDARAQPQAPEDAAREAAYASRCVIRHARDEADAAELHDELGISLFGHAEAEAGLSWDEGRRQVRGVSQSSYRRNRQTSRRFA